MSPSLQNKLANWEIAVYVLYICGGSTKRVSTEDIAVKCYELIPDSFSWVKYPQYPDKDVVRFALVDARKEKNGVLVQGRSGRGTGHTLTTKAKPALDGWELTKEGAQWIAENEKRLSKILENREINFNRQDDLKKTIRFHNHPLYKQFLKDKTKFVPNIGEMAELFRCRVDANQRTWLKRFERALNLAQVTKDNQLFEFINMCKLTITKVEEKDKA